MAFFTKKNNKKRKSKDGPSSTRKDAGRGKESASSHFFETSQLIEVSLFLLFSALIMTICYLGQKPKGPRIILNQAAQTRVVSEFQFQYESEVMAEAKAAAASHWSNMPQGQLRISSPLVISSPCLRISFHHLIS